MDERKFGKLRKKHIDDPFYVISVDDLLTLTPEQCLELKELKVEQQR